MMYQCRFILGNKCTTLVNSIENGGSCVCVGTEGIWGISVLSSRFLFVNLKLLFKIKAIFLKSGKNVISMKDET